MQHRILIAMSGGVDSSVTAALLKEQGYECIGIHLQMWTDRPSAGGQAKNKCCTLDGLEDARRVCEFLNIPFYVMNVEAAFKTRVVDYFLGGYENGETPNPCIECNRTIKFGDLLQRAEELQADKVATGHYARVIGGELFAAADKRKDQSYFLYTLTAEKLKKIMFPLGGFQKSEVYEMARKFGLPRVTEKPQSQGLCFFSEGNPKYFLERYLMSHIRPGPIVTLSGRVLGKHRGLPLYTIGQRSGLGIGGVKGEPEGEGWYVVSMDRLANRLIVGREKDIQKFEIVCEKISFVSGQPHAGRALITVRIRHRGVLTPAVLEMKEGRAFITSEESMKAPAAGQSAVFYEGEKVVGGGVIEKNYELRNNELRNNEKIKKLRTGRAEARLSR